RGRCARLRAALEKGIEKVLSTMGTHELAGYGPAFASVGLHPEAAREFPCPALLPGRRRPVAVAPERPRQVFRMAPKLWKAAGAVADGRRRCHTLTAPTADAGGATPRQRRRVRGSGGGGGARTPGRAAPSAGRDAGGGARGRPGRPFGRRPCAA